MPLLTLRNISLAFGAAPLLEKANLSIEPGDRLALVGRNGAGKSTLMKLLDGSIKPDSGEIDRSPGLVVAALVQDVPRHIHGSIRAVVAEGLNEAGQLVADYADLAEAVASQPERLPELERLQQKLEAANGWDLLHKVDATLSRLQLDGHAEFSQLSGGMKRRVLLAQALVQEPDLLLLDEPTNHLDIDSIEWLEQFLLGYRGALLFVTHDRAFLRRLATRIVDLDRGKLTDFPGDYDKYLEHKEALLENEARENALFDKRLAEEEVWIRQGIKARRTRNEGRVRALKQLRRERSERREVVGQARIELQAASASGKLVLEIEHLGFDHDNKPLIKDFSALVQRSDKIGIVGPNGVGKSTLLKLVLGQLEPSRGSVRQGTKLEVAYFDQLRAKLDLEKTVRENVVEGSDHVDINGKRKHVMGYLQDFLFTPDRARQPVKALSGGERNRLLLARLFTQPANLLVMDEPTNDLDVETLELLESLVSEFAGTVLIVSHDRDFLNNVATSTWAFEGNGVVREYVGGYDDWLRQRGPQKVEEKPKPKAEAKPAAPPAASAAPAKKKLSYKDQRELDELPARIEALESEQQALAARMSEPDFFKQPADETMKAQQRLANIEQELLHAYGRWEQLEGL